MFDDLAATFYEQTVPAFEAYRQVKGTGTAGRSRDTSAAIAAASALFHLREFLPQNYMLSRAQASRRCPDYSLVADIANASKHQVLTRETSVGPPQITNANQIQEEIVITQYEDQDGPYRCVDKRVIVQLSNGSVRDVLEVMTNVMNFWWAYLHAIGILKEGKTYSVPQVQEPRSRSDCGDGRLNFEILRGVRFHQKFRLLKFNPLSREIEPVDLTGANVRFVIRPRPRFDITLRLENKEGQYFEKTVTLSEEETEALEQLKTDEEKNSYVATLAITQEALKELAIEAGLSSRLHNE